MNLVIYIIVSVFIIWGLYKVTNKYNDIELLDIPKVMLCSAITCVFIIGFDEKVYFLGFLDLEEYKSNIFVDGFSILCFLITTLIIIKISFFKKTDNKY